MKIGRWTVLDGSGARWLCRCDCGTERTVSARELRRGGSRSCGCLQREEFASRAAEMGKRGKTTHGLANTPTYESWRSMRRRCLNPKASQYGHYGGRGITVCDRWRFSLENFVADMGLRPSLQHSLDRIDVDGNYEPGNCRWATQREQCQNMRTSVKVGGEPVAIVAEREGISVSGLRQRIRRGRALKGPPKIGHNRALSDEQARLIRATYVSGSRDFGQKALARRYGVNPSTIQRALAGFVSEQQ